MLLGTRVVEGDGTGVVIRIGDNCAVASVVAMAAQSEEETTLSLEIQRFIKIIVTMAVTAGTHPLTHSLPLLSACSMTEPAHTLRFDHVFGVVLLASPHLP